MLVEGLPAIGEVRHSQSTALKPLALAAGSSLLVQSKGQLAQLSPVCHGAEPVPGAAGWLGDSWFVAGGQHKPRACGMALPSHLTCFLHSPIP